MEDLNGLDVSNVSGTTGLLESHLQSSLSSLQAEVQQISEGTTNILGDPNGLIVDSGIVPFLEAEDGGHVILKAILDHNGALVLDSSQIAAIMSSVNFEATPIQENVPFITTNTSQAQSISQRSITPIAMKTLPLTSSHQNQRINTGIQVTAAAGLQNHRKSEFSVVNAQIQQVAVSSLVTSTSISNSKKNQDTIYTQSGSRFKAATAHSSSSGVIVSSSVMASNAQLTIPGPNIFSKEISINKEPSSTVAVNKESTCDQESENQQPRTHPSTSVDIEPPIGKGPHRCEVCGKVFLKWPQFKRHKSEHLDEKSHRCLLCSMSFNFESNLKLHTMIHEAELNDCLECKVCPAKFSRLASLRSHVRIHEKEENLVCPECGDEFATKARLDTHIEEHKTTKSLLYRCKLCQKSFTQAALLKDHAKEHSAVRNQLKILHPRRRKAAKPKSSILKSTDPNEEMSKARQRQENKKKLLCAVCSKRFEKPSQLSRHMRIHTGEKPFACKDCGRSFNQKGTLESHILSMHEKLKPFVCHLCSCQFSQRGNLKAHVLKVHVPPGDNERVFKCEECSCVYRRLATLNTHIAKFHTKSSPQPSENDKPATTSNVMQSTCTTGTEIASTQKSSSQTVLSSDTSPETKKMAVNEEAKTNSDVNITPPVPPKNSENSKPNEVLPTVPQQQEQTGKNQIAEVKLAHEAQGKSKTCVVKVKRIGQDKWHLCPYNCTKAFRKPSDLIRHMRIHTQERPFTCEICGKSFAVKSTLNTHLKIHTSLKEWECSVCHKQFSMITSLRAHERLHTGAKPFPCLQCGKCFRTSSQRRMHTKVHTRNAQGPSGKRKLLRIGDTDPKLDLPDPLKITSDGLVPVPNRASQSIIKPNTIQDGKIRPYRCTLCPSAFKKSSHLKQHQRSHSGERPYKCYQCNRSFISSGVLKNHIKTHEGVRAYKCHMCHLSFTTNGSLTRHMTTHTDIRAFVCPYCHKTFKTSVACRKHIKTHRSEFVAFRTKGDESSISNLNSSVPENFRVAITSKDTSGLVNDVQNENVANAGFSQDTEIIYNDHHHHILSDDHFETAYGTGVNSSNMDVSHQAQLTLQESNPLLSSIPNNNNANSLSDCTASMQQQIQEITAMIESGHLGSGEISLQYSLPAGASLEDVANQIAMAEGHGFDSSIFTLQGGDSIDLPASLPPLMPLSTANIPQDSLNSIQPSSFESEMDSVYPLKQTDNFSVSSQPSNSNPVSKVDDKKISVPHKDQDENSQIKRIRESSRSISQQIYDEMKGIVSDSFNKRNDNAKGEVLEQDKAKVNVCPVCSRGFKKRSDMLRHIRIHTGEKPFRCHLCGKSFRVKSTRDAHLRTHEGGKTVACHVCNNLFSTKSSLRVHIRLHTGAKPYKCFHCDRCFRTSGHRKAHTQSHFKVPKESNVARNDSVLSVAAVVPNSEEPSNKNSQVLPPVGTIKEKMSSVVGNVHIADLGTATSHFATSTNDNSLLGTSASLSDPVQLIGSLHLTLDGTAVQNIHITNLDLNSFQISDEFLQSFGNVIFMTPNNQLGVASNDVVGSNPNIIGVAVQNGEDGTVTQQDEHQHYQNSTSLSHISHQQTSSVLTGKDVNIGNSVTNMPALTQIQNAFASTLSAGDLDALAISNDSNLMPSFNSLTASTITSTASSASTSSTQKRRLDKNNSAAPQTQSNKQCLTCGKIFAKPSLLKRHMTTHTGEKPYKCDMCSCTFNQKNSLDVHKYTHSNERPFSCSLCPFKTVVKAALKKHWSRAHPNSNWDEVNLENSLSGPMDSSSNENQNLVRVIISS